MDSINEWKRRYDDLLSKGDPRVATWLLMDSPLPSAAVSVLYVVLVLVSMRWMRSRPPFNLRPLMVAYNLAMVVFSAWLVYGFCAYGWLTGYSLHCQPVDFSWSPRPLAMASVCWWFYFSKFIELLDTFFFVFRGRFELITFLHVFHHAVLPPAWWWGVKFVPGGFGSFPAVLNSVVHTVMYLYYGLAAIGPSMQPYLWWKRYLTKFQMVQFVTMVVHSMQLYFIECDYPKHFATAIMCFACIFFVLFANFYVQSYLKNSRAKRAASAVANGDASPKRNGVSNGQAARQRWQVKAE